MRYTQNGFMEDEEPRQEQKSSWLAAFAQSAMLVLISIATVLVITIGVYALRAVLDAMTRIFP
jgi:hypothetical protein